MSRLWRVVLVTVMTLAAASPAASAANPRLGDTLGAVWETVFETPTPDNPFAGGDPCLDLGGGVLAPFTALGAPALTCTVKPGTRIFVTTFSSECSNVEAPPYFGEDEPSLRACVQAVDAGITLTELTVDGRPVPLTEVESGLLELDLPADNIVGAPAGDALSLAHGWVALLHPLTPGSHELVLHAEGTYLGDPLDLTQTTTIVVEPGH